MTGKRLQMVKTDQPRKVRVGSYLRVSSARQALEGDSLEAQRNIVNAYVAQKEAVGELEDADVRFFIEPGRSGKPDRSVGHGVVLRGA